MVELRSGRSTMKGEVVNESGDNQSIRKQLHLVTGGGGYAGYCLGLSLLREGHLVKLIDIRQPKDTPPAGITFEKCDLRDHGAVERALEGAHTVYHMASYGMSGREQLDKHMIEQVNVQGTKNVLKACQKLSIHHLVYTSTCNVIFGGQQIENGDESLPYLPLEKHPDHYSRTKSIAEQYVVEANDSLTSDGGKLYTCALRLAGVYGPGEQRHLPRIVGYIQQGLFSVTYGSQDSLVDFLHVDNLVQAHVKAGRALTDQHQHVSAGQTYFISDSKPVNSFEFFRPLVEGLGYRYPVISLPLTLVYFIAFLTEWIHYIVSRIYNFQPLLTRTEVYKTGVTHYFSTKKARDHFGYIPTIQNDMDSVTKWFLDRGYHKKQKKNSALMRLLRDLALAVICAIVLLCSIPYVS